MKKIFNKIFAKTDTYFLSFIIAYYLMELFVYGLSFVFLFGLIESCFSNSNISISLDTWIIMFFFFCLSIYITYYKISHEVDFPKFKHKNIIVLTTININGEKKLEDCHIVDEEKNTYKEIFIEK